MTSSQRPGALSNGEKEIADSLLSGHERLNSREKKMWNRLFLAKNDHLFTAEAAHKVFAGVKSRRKAANP